jgi:hypothetical protein
LTVDIYVITGSRLKIRILTHNHPDDSLILYYVVNKRLRIQVDVSQFRNEYIKGYQR